MSAWILALGVGLFVFSLFPPLRLRTVGALWLLTPYVVFASSARVGSLAALSIVLAAICALAHGVLALIAWDYPAARAVLGSSFYVVVVALAVGVPILAAAIGMVAKARAERRAHRDIAVLAAQGAKAESGAASH